LTGDDGLVSRVFGAVSDITPSKEAEEAMERASLVFKKSQVVRFYDAKRNALVYLAYTDRIIEGSPRNSISVVPLGR